MVYTGSNSGSWTGAEVDSNYDPYVPAASSNTAYLSNIILQTFENAITQIMTAIDNSQASAGTPYENITLTVQDYDNETITANQFADPVCELGGTDVLSDIDAIFF